MSKLSTICFASNNKGKISEIQSIFQGKIKIVSMREAGFTDEIEETGNTFEANARLKAETVFKATGIPCFADDSGLLVQALNGEPGVYSARYAGPTASDQENIKKLLLKLKNKKNRIAHFKTVIAFIEHAAKDIQYFEGSIEGTITEVPKGLGGFGYDPIFIPESYHETFAEISAEEKNAISHRAKAMEKFIQYLKRTI
jgi:XTP/dITP diphosphohydrolase